MQYKKLWIALTLVVLVAEFLQTDLMNQLRWLRTIGDTIFAVGALLLGWFVLGLVTGHSYDKGLSKINLYNFYVVGTMV